jgi:hypothetical protein
MRNGELPKRQPAVFFIPVKHSERLLGGFSRKVQCYNPERFSKGANS